MELFDYVNVIASIVVIISAIVVVPKYFRDKKATIKKHRIKLDECMLFLNVNMTQHLVEQELLSLDEKPTVEKIVEIARDNNKMAKLRDNYAGIYSTINEIRDHAEASGYIKK